MNPHEMILPPKKPEETPGGILERFRKDLFRLGFRNVEKTHSVDHEGVDLLDKMYHQPSGAWIITRIYLPGRPPEWP